MKRVILCPNPYRDSELTVAKRSRELLEGLGFETVVCLPFSRWASIWGVLALCPSWSPTSWNGCVT